MKKIDFILGMMFFIVILTVPIFPSFLFSEAYTGETFYVIPTRQKTFTIGWQHSVELQPWLETYRINKDGSFDFVETRMKTFGAGTPDVDGEISFRKDGYVVIHHIDRKLTTYPLFYSDHSHYYVRIAHQTYKLKDFIPNDTSIRISYQKINGLKMLKTIQSNWGERDG